MEIVSETVVGVSEAEGQYASLKTANGLLQWAARVVRMLEDGDRIIVVREKKVTR